MKREHIAGVVTVVALLGLLAALGIRNRGEPTFADKPSTVVFDLFQRAKAGDVRGYLSCFGPELRQTVEGSRRDMGERAFREQIEAMGEAVKGVLVQEDRMQSREARLRVELVYADRTHNDVQTFTLNKSRGRWLISSMSRAKPLKMPIPYGTPAYPLELDAQPESGAQAPAGASSEAVPPTEAR